MANDGVLPFPDLEAVATKALQDAGYSAYSSIPNHPTWPLMVVHRAGGTPSIRQYLDSAIIQVDIWGGAKGDATPVPKSTIHDMAQIARTVLHDLAGQTITTPVAAFISGVDDAQGMIWLPDPDTGRDRYLFQVWIHGRSTPAVS